MIKITDLLTEELNIYSIEVLIKTDREINKVQVYHHIRALIGVVVVTVEKSEYLESKATDEYEYSLLHIKFLVHSTPEADIKKMRTDALVTTKIEGLVQFIPRFNTIDKKGLY